MSESDDEFRESLGETGKELLQEMTPTEEDIRQDLSQDQLHKLCRRVKSYVDVSKWNPVYDFQKYYTDQGRFKGQSKRYVHKLLIKTYKRHPEIFAELTSTQAIEWQQQWRQRKKNSLMLLKLWEYDENMMREGEKEQSQWMEDDETLHVAQLSGDAQQTATTAADQPTLEDIENYENMPLEGEKEQSQSVEDEDDGQKLHAAQLSGNAQQTATITADQAALADSELIANNSGSVNSVVHDLMLLNSESITVCTEMLNSEAFPSQPIAPLQPDELCPEAVVIFDSENYEGFNNSIPLTSTQDPFTR